MFQVGHLVSAKSCTKRHVANSKNGRRVLPQRGVMGSLFNGSSRR
jgi:hypothetical protein